MTPNHSDAAQGAAAYRRRMTPKQMEAEVFARAARANTSASTCLGVMRRR